MFNRKKSKVKVVNIEASSPEDAMKKVKAFMDKNNIKPIAAGTPAGILTPFGLSQGGKRCSCGCDRDPASVLKTVPATAEEVRKNKELFERINALKKEEEKLKAEKEKWWAEVRLRLPDGYEHNSFHYNQDTKEIEYMKDDEGDTSFNL